MNLVWDLRTQWTRRPGKTWLAFPAVALGCAAIALLLSVAEGIQRDVNALVRTIGADTIVVVAEERGALTQADPGILKAAFPDTILSRIRYDGLRTVNGVRMNVIAVDPSFSQAVQFETQRGTFFSPQDTSAPLIVLQQGSLDHQAVLPGQTVWLDQTPLSVVGAVNALPEPVLQGFNIDSRYPVCWVPLDRQASWLDQSVPYHSITALLIQPQDQPIDPDLLPPLLSSGGASRDIAVVSSSGLLTQVNRLKGIVTIAASVMGFICLALAAITLSSLMAQQVRERWSEIGLRRALGASRNDIAFLFVLEGLLITSMGALCGIAISLVVQPLLTHALPFPTYAGPLSILAPCIAAISTGIFASAIPARIAAQINVSQSLRAE